MEHSRQETVWPADEGWSAEAYEAWVTAVSGLDPDDWRDQRWTAAYRRVSADIVGRPQGVGRTTAREDGRDGLVVRALVFGQRTALVLEGLMESGWADGRTIVDVGSGTGPGALVALAAGARRVLSVEPGRAECEWLESARVRCPRPDAWRMEQRALEPRSLDPELGEIWLFGFSFLELAGPKAAAARAAAQRLVAAGRRVLILEAGTRASATRLAEVRDSLPADVRRPCRGATRCPRGAGSEAWCHFTWKRSLGPAAVRILQRAGRRSNLVHFSYLDLQQGATRTTGRRLIEILRRGRRARRLHLCGPEGEARMEVSPKPKSVWRWSERLEAGVLLAAPEALNEEGGGAVSRLRVPLATLGSSRST